ncbi:MAG: transcription elongation factor GreA [bacterium]|nr:transcription elongation factor GreA [bacterium]
MSERKKIFLTQEGYDEIREELNYLINEKRPENIIAIKEARALGDLSENADYDAARNEQAEIEARIKKLEAVIENVEIIDEVSTDKVGLGNTVKISYVDDDDVDEYKIVGSQEADPFESKISNESPIAKALMGHKVGDVVSVLSPNGSYEVEIVEIG